jgi:hypothetical protein
MSFLGQRLDVRKDKSRSSVSSIEEAVEARGRRGARASLGEDVIPTQDLMGPESEYELPEVVIETEEVEEELHARCFFCLFVGITLAMQSCDVCIT